MSAAQFISQRQPVASVLNNGDNSQELAENCLMKNLPN